jgi:hypothetical protein
VLITRIDMDNGSFPLAKDSLRALAKTTLSGGHRAVIDVIWMETYGWFDKDSQHQERLKQRLTVAQIPHETFVSETWMDKTAISRILNQLVEWNIITRNKNTSPISYSFNVNVSEWAPEIIRKTKVAEKVNSCTISQQLPTESINSCMNSQPTVDQSVNSCMEQTQTPQGFGDSLNNVKEILNKNTYVVRVPEREESQEPPPDDTAEVPFNEPPVDSTEYERHILRELKSVKNYPFDYAADLEHLRSLAVDFPDIDILAEVKKWRVYKLDKPLEKKSNPRLQFRNWCEIALKGRDKHGIGKAQAGSRHPGQARASPDHRHSEYDSVWKNKRAGSG